jgi:phage gp36-like protein
MSNWISTTDYKSKITDNRIQMIIDQDEELLDNAEITAIAVVRDFLYSRYEVDEIFATSGTDRPAQVVRWCTNLAMYYIYERVPDKLTPERITKNYDETMAILLEISDGKKAVDLPHKTDDNDIPVTKFRWGGQAAREHS